MAGFLTPLRVERLDSNKWRVIEEFDYRIGADKSPLMVRVYAGFITDFASIPRGMWNVFPPVGGEYDKAAVVHDMLYQDPRVVNLLDNSRIPIDKAKADGIFLEAMTVLGVSKWKRTTIYLAVKFGGSKAWNAHRAQDMVGV